MTEKTAPISGMVKFLMISLLLAPIGWIYALLNMGVIGYTLIGLSVACYSWFNYWAGQFHPKVSKDSKSDRLGYSVLGSFFVVGDYLFVWSVIHFIAHLLFL